jgi:hypothetical protein
LDFENSSVAPTYPEPMLKSRPMASTSFDHLTSTEFEEFCFDLLQVADQL